ncbi:MAG: response regulator [Pseudomonadota bacterium]
MASLLLMEDDVVLGMEMAEKLRLAGHEVTICHTAAEAKEELWRWDYDVLITDIIVRRDNRPVPDGGLGLISWVRHKGSNTPNLKRLPVIAITGEQNRPGMGFLLPVADRIGADLVLEKPIDMSKLLREITRILADKT